MRNNKVRYNIPPREVIANKGFFDPPTNRPNPLLLIPYGKEQSDAT